MDYNALANALRDRGATVETSVDIFPLIDDRHPIFSVDARNMEVNGEIVTVLEYPDEVIAEVETKRIGRDGFDFTVPETAESEGIGVHVDWIAPPHFYQRGRIIVFYAGETQVIMDWLEDLLGMQFAGNGPVRQKT